MYRIQNKYVWLICYYMLYNYFKVKKKSQNQKLTPKLLYAV
jgi:hypothetical protein